MRWTLEDEAIDLAGAPEESGDAIDSAGAGLALVGFGTVGTVLQGWRWTPEGGIAALPQTASGLTIPFAISEDGLVVAGMRFDGDVTAFRWTETMGFQRIPVIGPSMQGQAISGDGSTVVGVFGEGGPGPLAFAWRAERGSFELPLTFPFLWTMEDGISRKVNVSYDGRFVAGAREGTASLYDLETDTLTTLTWSDGSPVSGTGTAVTADGTVVVGNVDNGHRDAFIWDSSHGARYLRSALLSDYGLSVDLLRSVQGISADGGVIAGTRWVVTLWEPQPYRGRPPCQGDVDGDQRVGLSDLLFVLGEWRRPEPDLAADITGDGIVDQLDLNIVLVDFGDDCARRRIQQAGR